MEISLRVDKHLICSVRNVEGVSNNSETKDPFCI